MIEAQTASPSFRHAFASFEHVVASFRRPKGGGIFPRAGDAPTDGRIPRRFASRDDGARAARDDNGRAVRNAGSRHCRTLILAVLTAAIGWSGPGAAAADPSPAGAESSAGHTDPIYVPDISRWLPKANDREALNSSMQIFVLLTVLTVAPSIVLMMTCFTRILVVLALLRQALGTQQLPPSQVLVGLALFMTILVMAPTWNRVREQAVDPYLAGQIQQLDAIQIASRELRSFMFAQIKAARNEQDVLLMHEYATQRAIPDGESVDESEVATTALIPAYILSELKAAFVIGFRIYLPFLVIDMVIATVLVAMGMMMLPPVLISLPFKLLLFVMVDGWHLIAASLMASIQA
jgi:flagellar biosynthetic protein FliP